MTNHDVTDSRRTTIIAEVGQAHDGSLGILHSLVEAAAESGVDVVKFQMHLADAESTPMEQFRVPFSYVDKTRQDYWRRMELTPDQWFGLKEKCGRLGVEFLVTPFSRRAVDLLEDLDVQRYKVGSADATNFVLLDRIAETGKSVILSTGMANDEELIEVIQFLDERSVQYALLHCVSTYPASAASLNLGRLAVLRERYKCPVGFSDHTGSEFASLGAVALGASLVEFHITFDQRMFGPDAASSLSVVEASRLVRGIRFLDQATGQPRSGGNDDRSSLRAPFARSLAAARDLQSGRFLSWGDLEAVKANASGIPVECVRDVVGRALNENLQAGEVLQWSQLS